MFDDVDRVLRQYGMEEEPVSRKVRVKTVAHALNRMMKMDKWMDVTTIKSSAEICNICIPKERMRIYKTIHCVHWNEMEKEYRTMIIAMVLDDFREILTSTEL